MASKKKLYIETVGCQMNVLDSELVVAALLGAGYELVGSARQADAVLFNTCSVRQHAEDKIYSALGRLKHVKERQPQKIIGVIGCMAQKDQDLIFQRAPHVDLVVGPGQLAQLPAMLERIESGQGPQMGVSLERNAGRRSAIAETFERYDPLRSAQARPSRYQAMLRIMFGCDKFCSYCIVPSVRGPEQSRPAAEIEAEVRALAAQGCVEVTLIGQTVNSYRHTEEGKTTRLSDLLYRLHDIEGIRRFKFVTNYPRHMTHDLLEAVRDLPKVSPYLHVPAQSGSNAVLKRMKRGYTVEEYREMLAATREILPDAAVTSDFIVGFCGETEDDFQQSVELVRQSRFKNSFIFKYSPRPHTKSAELYPDDVPEEVKRRRNNELLAVQNAISLEDSRLLAGRIVEVLVEGPSKSSRKQAAAGPNGQLTGRTVRDQIVVFSGEAGLIGRIVPVRIVETNAFTLFGEVMPPHA
ncbi:MAG: tRNA (N6-isopentenyl adenosine(37)-C2)-methylthiotransferase MiaB [Thermoguttaceae bacterium]|nr:tRNA (N6-isopentenyl adenosine(37)-C2)-methylthiotransferase MiaB [Thermoguttaceae bacterium]